jgi:hypothetical protein
MNMEKLMLVKMVVQKLIKIARLKLMKMVGMI